MTFDEFLELTEDAVGNQAMIVDVGGRYADVIDIEIEGNQIVITIED